MWELWLPGYTEEQSCHTSEFSTRGAHSIRGRHCTLKKRQMLHTKLFDQHEVHFSETFYGGNSCFPKTDLYEKNYYFVSLKLYTETVDEINNGWNAFWLYEENPAKHQEIIHDVMNAPWGQSEDLLQNSHDS